MSNVRIDIASQFDNKGFKQAEAAMGGLEKSIGRLGKQLAGVFTAGALASFTKNSIKAFMEDEASLIVFFLLNSHSFNNSLLSFNIH